MSRSPRLAAPVAVVLLAGCGGPRSILSPAGSGARTLAAIGWPALIAFGVVSAILAAMVLGVALRRTGTFDEHAPADVGGGYGWVLIGGVAIPFVAFATAFVVTVRTLATDHVAHSTEPPAIAITGHQWWWEARYLDPAVTNQFVTANEIHIPAGRPIDIELRSDDVVHSLWVPRLQGKVDLIPGQVTRIQLEADAPGTYEGVCAELCGTQHTHMQLLVIADDEAHYAAWRAAQLADARAPTAADGQRGAALFATRACVLCHTIRGTAAHGAVGPDLTHLASRRTLAAGSFPNDVATLSAWVVNAQSLKPGARMPSLNQFTGPELHQLVAYLQTLE
jgi:cytochrome c oxidase subunit 2